MNFIDTVNAILRKILIPLVIAFLIFAGGLYVFHQVGAGALKEADRYPVFRDVLAIVLSATTLTVAVIGVGAYTLLRNSLRSDVAREATGLFQDYVAKETNDTLKKATAQSLVHQAYALWGQYTQSKENNLLEMAIQFSAGASYQMEGVDQNDPKNEEMICTLRSNWGYYLLEKEDPSDADKQLALGFADYLDERISKYPGHRMAWTDTVLKIREIFGDQ